MAAMNDICIEHKNNKILLKNWKLFKSKPFQFQSPADFTLDDQLLYTASVPGTVAMAVNGNEPECWLPNGDYDDYDWWYSIDFASSIENLAKTPSTSLKIQFDGLATLCEVWLNNKILLNTDNMFRGYECIIPNQLNKDDKLFLVFRSVSNELNKKRPRPRWKTKLVENQQMRWIRSTVLGHVSSWTPPIKAIGPWKAISIEVPRNFEIIQTQLTSTVESEQAKVNLSINLKINDPVQKPTSASLEINGHSYPITLGLNQDTIQLSASISIPEIDFWWPHTHGNPKLYDYKILVSSANQSIEIKAGRLGFKSSLFVTNSEETALYINSEKIFCRGTCWSVSDYLSLNANEEKLRQQLTLIKNSGINMLRIGGTMVYESDAFYSLCDELGILIWQDFMFASMDYPFDDSDFLDNVTQEIKYQLQRLSNYTCVSLYCGNTDIEAQAAMYGLPKETWKQPFFETLLPEFCNELHTGIPYIPSSPTGGALPFHLSKGVTHYWGVGAYMKPVSDQNMQRVKFASEGMGLSHIPEESFINKHFGQKQLFPFSNDWHYRIPRDLGAGWGFDEIRDFYLEDIFGIDARKTKRSNPEYYIALSRVVTGEAIANVYKYWRSQQSQCNGGLIWFNRDFWPCAGFGIIDSDGLPKAAMYQLAQVWKSQQVILSNEGFDGANVTIINESNTPLNGKLEICLIKDGNKEIAKNTRDLCIEQRQTENISVDEMLEGFYDTGYAYCFGECHYDVIHATLLNSNEEIISENSLFTDMANFPKVASEEIEISATKLEDKLIELKIKSCRFLQFVNVKINGFTLEQNYFHLSPNKEKTIVARQSNNEVKKFKGHFKALNLTHDIRIKLSK